MKKIHSGSGVIKLTIFVLTFFIIFTPFTPVFAQEADVTLPADSAPASAQDTLPVVDPPADSAQPISPVSETPVVNEEPVPIPATENLEADPNAEETNPVDSEDTVKKDKTDDVLSDIQPDAMMGIIGSPYLNMASSTIKSYLPQIDELSGSLKSSYPLTIPPGRNNLQPDLQLTYSSQNGEEGKIFGDRWSLNIPSVERINRDGTNNLYTESYFNSTIDGELVNISTGVYGAKVENGQFNKYEFSSNVWIVTDKNGTKYKFGTTASSRLDNPNDSTKIFRWMLDEVRDRNDNYIKYEYYKDQGEVYPSVIKYTGNGSTDGIFEIDFLRTSRSHAIVSAKPGFFISAGYYISEIDVKVNSTWVRKYVLAYSSSDNGQSLLLNTITETGQDESSNTISLPVEDFDYQTATSGNEWGWEMNINWQPPVDMKDGVIIADANGDGLDDIIQSFGAAQNLQRTYLNNGAGWTLSNDFVPPVIFKDDGSSIKDQGVRAMDVNGDGLVDLVKRKNGTSATYLNNGTGWTSTSNWHSTLDFVGGSNSDTGTRIGDFNGDGLPDLIKNDDYLYLNNGINGWTSVSWTIPVDMEYGVLIADVNGDSLDDLIQSWSPNGSTFYKQSWLNNGNGWTLSSDFVPPTDVFVGTGDGKDMGYRAIDVNGDGLADIVRRTESAGSYSYLNNGTGWTSSSYWRPPYDFVDRNGDTGTRMGDFNGDGKIDFIKTYVYFHIKDKADLLNKVTYPRGGSTSVTYQGSAQYKSGSTYLNPNLPMSMVTVKQLTNNDGLGNTSTSQFSYEGGKYYFNTPLDRKFAGFGKVVKTDAVGNKTKTFYHQGDTSDSSHGEYNDDHSKIGKIYRIEITDSSDSIYAKKISKWENYDLGNGNDFVKLTQAVEQTYDGDTDHKDKASTYTYNNANGNLTEQVDRGEVAGSDDGTFSDTGSDKFTSTLTYASNTTYNIYGLPKQEIITDQNSNKVRESKYYYDSQSFGDVTNGNLTKEEKWKTGSNYIDYEKTYNSYGLVTQEKDPRDKITDYTYDSYNLYPATATNALNQETDYTYDYSLGKPKQVTEPNTRVFQTVFDALDRVKEEKQPDLTTPSTLVTKIAYAYTGQTVGNQIHKTEYLDGSTSVDTYTYTDGFDRVIQTRKEMENSNTFAVSDTIYNNIEQLYKESIPYSGSGTSKTSPTTTTALLIVYSYDPMYRITSTVNAVGTTSNAYDDWKLTITDPRSKTKDLYKDAYGNLIRVDEHNSGNTYTTAYEYDGNGKLTKITDALSNIRNFTYDGLGRRLTAEDLHASGDSSYGSWSYTYDDSGNLIEVVDPDSQTIDYTYDDINRKLTENYTGNAGTEVTYSYDSGTDGIGRLTSVASTGADTAYIYNPLGKVIQEIKTIDSTNYQTDYAFDRQGNTLTIINPDSSIVKYTYNTAGQLETIQREESTDGSYIDVVTDFDYGPHGKMTSQTNANGTTITNTYDSTKLYRLTRKQTGGAPTPQTASFYSSSGDGHVYKNGSSWDLAHDATTGNSANYTNNVAIAGTSMPTGITYAIYRTFLPFNTAALPDDAVITAASLNVYTDYKSNGDNDGDDWITVVQTNQASTSSLTTADFDNAGAINNPTEGIDTSERKDITSVSTDQYIILNLNTTGKSWISSTGYTKLGLREGHDVIDSPFAVAGQQDSFTARTVDFTDTASDPYLQITYTSASAGGNALQDVSYTYDANGNITQIVDASNTSSSKTVNYVYDDLNRLTSATATNVASGQSTYTKTYTYDAIGNITVGDAGNYTYAGDQGASYANPHAVTSTSTGSLDYTYDNNGNLTNDETWTHAWDYNNRLVESDDGTTDVAYAYDQDGQRVKLDNGTVATLYPSKYYNTDGTTPIKHILTPDGQVIATVKGTGAGAVAYTVSTDHLTGSNVVTDSSGTVAELLDYYPYGSARIDDHVSYNEQRKFTGQEYDSDTGLYYMNARYQNPTIGRFVSQDPVFLALGDNGQIKQLTQQELRQILSDPQNLNSYSYGRNNPLSYQDPNGQFSITWNGYKTGLNFGWSLLQSAGNYIYNKADSYYDAPNSTSDGSQKSQAAAMQGMVYLGQLGGKDAYFGFGVGSIENVGSRIPAGFQLGQKVEGFGQVVENTAGKITGFFRSEAPQPYHGLDRVIERGVNPQAILSTVKNPLITFEQANGNTYRLSEQAAVILDKVGKVVTSYGSNNFAPRVVNLLSKLGK